MSDDALDMLFPDLTGPNALPRWEVTFRVLRRDGGEPLVPLDVPRESGAIACWTATEGTAVVTVETATEDEHEAWAAAAMACPGWAALPRVMVSAVRAR